MVFHKKNRFLFLLVIFFVLSVAVIFSVTHIFLSSATYNKPANEKLFVNFEVDISLKQWQFVLNKIRDMGGTIIEPIKPSRLSIDVSLSSTTSEAEFIQQIESLPGVTGAGRVPIVGFYEDPPSPQRFKWFFRFLQFFGLVKSF